MWWHCFAVRTVRDADQTLGGKEFSLKDTLSKNGNSVINDLHLSRSTTVRPSFIKSEWFMTEFSFFGGEVLILFKGDIRSFNSYVLRRFRWTLFLASVYIQFLEKVLLNYVTTLIMFSGLQMARWISVTLYSSHGVPREISLGETDTKMIIAALKFLTVQNVQVAWETKCHLC